MRVFIYLILVSILSTVALAAPLGIDGAVQFPDGKGSYDEKQAQIVITNTRTGSSLEIIPEEDRYSAVLAGNPGDIFNLTVIYAGQSNVIELPVRGVHHDANLLFANNVLRWDLTGLKTVGVPDPFNVFGEISSWKASEIVFVNTRTGKETHIASEPFTGEYLGVLSGLTHDSVEVRENNKTYGSFILQSRWTRITIHPKTGTIDVTYDVLPTRKPKSSLLFWIICAVLVVLLATILLYRRSKNRNIFKGPHSERTLDGKTKQDNHR